MHTMAQTTTATASSIMVATTVWVTPVTFGRLLRPVVSMSGSVHCITIIHMYTGTSTSTSVSITGLVFVAWGISPVDYLINKALHLWGFFIYLAVTLSYSF